MEENTMEKATEKLKDLTRKLVKGMIDEEVDGWPPECTVFAYQPMRPCREELDVTGSDEATTGPKK